VARGVGLLLPQGDPQVVLLLQLGVQEAVLNVDRAPER